MKTKAEEKVLQNYIGMGLTSFGIILEAFKEEVAFELDTNRQVFESLGRCGRERNIQNCLSFLKFPTKECIRFLCKGRKEKKRKEKKEKNTPSY